jgi:hypothetical protein
VPIGCGPVGAGSSNGAGAEPCDEVVIDPASSIAHIVNTARRRIWFMVGLERSSSGFHNRGAGL